MLHAHVAHTSSLLFSGTEAGAIPIEQPHIKAPPAFGHRLANPTEANQPKGGTADIGTQKLHGVPARPLPGAHHALAFANAPGGREQQREGDVRRGTGEHAGVFVTGILRAVAAATSMLLKPTPKFATTFK
jgi:hypothetical protein